MSTPSGSRIRQLRRRRGLSIRELARRAGVGERTLRDLEHNRTDTPQPATIQAVAGALLVDPELLFEYPVVPASAPEREVGSRVAFLLILDASHRPLSRKSIYRESVTVGRSEDNGVFLADPSVSMLHAHLSIGSERVWVRDLGSTNGTWIRGERIHDCTSVAFGEPIGIGSYEIQIYAPETPFQEIPALVTLGIDKGNSRDR